MMTSGTSLSMVYARFRPFSLALAATRSRASSTQFAGRKADLPEFLFLLHLGEVEDVVDDDHERIPAHSDCLYEVSLFGI